MFITILALLLSVNLDKAIEHSRKGDYEASEALLASHKGYEPTFLFYKMINAYKLNKKEECIKYANLITDDFRSDFPLRYRDMAILLKSDIDTWKDTPDDLGDISREMDRATDRLKNHKGGKETQKIQKDVLDRLAKMIKDAEDAQNAAKEAAEKEAEAQQPQPPQNPAIDTQRGNEQGTGQVDPKRVKEIAEVWGKLPAKERAKAMLELTKYISNKDKAVMEAYVRELQRRTRK